MNRKAQYELILKTMIRYPKFAKQLKLYVNNWTRSSFRNTEIRIGGILISDSVLRLIWEVGRNE